MKTSTGEIRQTITPDFSHRILNDRQNLDGLTDSVGEMLNNTRGILYAIVSSAENINMQPKHTANAAFAAIQNLDDIDAYLKAFAKSQTNTQ